MFGGIRERFRDDVIRGHFDRLRKIDIDIEHYRKSRAARERSQCAAEPTFGQDRRVNASRDLPQLVLDGPRPSTIRESSAFS